MKPEKCPICRKLLVDAGKEFAEERVCDPQDHEAILAQTKLFAIRVFDREAYVADGVTCDSQWFTTKPTQEIVKTYKTRAGAEKRAAFVRATGVPAEIVPAYWFRVHATKSVMATLRNALTATTNSKGVCKLQITVDTK